jgi:hypothetical protein
MGAHIVNGTFQSDKYPQCPAGKVPLSVKDKAAQPLLWQYAQTHRSIDPEFSDDLETALRAAGYSPPASDDNRMLTLKAYAKRIEELSPGFTDAVMMLASVIGVTQATDTRPRLVPKHEGDCTVWCHDGRCYEISTLTVSELADRLAKLEERVA